MEKPYWSAVLRHFERNNYVNNGLTIPFLIGARKIIEPNESLFTIPELLNSMDDSGISITIMRCGNIDEYIFGLLDTETENYIQLYTKSYDVIGKIVCTDDSLKGFAELSEIISMLNREYEALIEKENYSKNFGVWGDFSKLDTRRISEILKQNQ